jgi:hypothetical protein
MKVTKSIKNITFRNILKSNSTEGEMKKGKGLLHLEISEEATADLRARQSVRTTFKLSERSINALSALAGQLGIKQKSLFDHLIEDRKALQLIAKEFEDFAAGSRRVAKTYVISRRTLDSLEKVSKAYDAPRDALVEYSIERILPLLEKEKEKHGQRKRLMADLSTYLEDGYALARRAEQRLDPEDPAYRELLPMVRAVENAVTKIARMVDRGEKMESL